MSGGKAQSGVIEQGGSRYANWMNNIAIVRATTTNTGDSIKITGADGTALSPSNYGWVTLPDPTNQGRLVTFSVTADVTLLLTGCTWGNAGLGDLTGAILRVLACNDNGTLRWGVAFLGGRSTLLFSDTNATQANVNLPEEVLTDVAVASATNSCREVGYFRADFDDTGGAAEDLWTVQNGVGDVVTGGNADGLWRAWNPVFTGFDVGQSQTTTRAVWTQIGRTIHLSYDRNALGTSSATSLTCNAPAKALVTSNGQSGIVSRTTNNSIALTTTGRVDTAVGSVTLSFYIDQHANAWTNSGTKGVDFFLTYDVGPAASFLS